MNESSRPVIGKNALLSGNLRDLPAHSLHVIVLQRDLCNPSARATFSRQAKVIRDESVIAATSKSDAIISLSRANNIFSVNRGGDVIFPSDSPLSYLREK